MSQLPSSTLLDFRDEKKKKSEEKALHVGFANSLPQAVVATGGVGLGEGGGPAEHRA